MGLCSCKTLAMSVAFLGLLMTFIDGQSDDDSMVCYKPPPQLNGSSNNHPGLFYSALKIKTPSFNPDSLSFFNFNVTVYSVVLNIIGDCGLGIHFVSSLSLLSEDLELAECKYNSLVQTSLPKTSISVSYITHDGGRQSIIKAFLVFKDIIASDDALNLTCHVNLGKNVGILRTLPNMSINIFLRLLGCPHALYGINCSRPCHCDVGVECHPFTGVCICPKGLHGQSCSIAKPSLMSGPSSIFLQFGDTVNLNCTTYGMDELTSWMWDQGGTDLNTDISSEEVLYSPRPIRITTKVTASSAAANGMYTCTVMYNKKSYSRNVMIIVTDIPDPFLEAPANQTVILGNSTEFRCRTKPEAGTQRWMSGDQTIISLSNITASGVRMMTRNPNDVSLIFDHVRFKDAGMYRCIVGHDRAKDSSTKEVWLTVQSQVRPFLTTLTRSGIPGDVLRLKEDEQMVVICQVNQVYPEPVLSWLIGEENHTSDAKVTSNHSEDGVSFSVHSLLTLKPSWEDDGKGLICESEVSDFKQERSRVIWLDVSYSPKVTVDPKGVTYQPGDSPVFNCSALGNPSGNMSYKWALIGRNDSVMKRYTGSSVQLQNVKTHYNKASLLCFVENGVGISSDKAVIRVFDPPPSDDRLHYGVMISALSVVVILIIVVPAVIFKHRTKIHEMFFNRQKRAGNKLHDVFVAYKGGGEEEEFIVQSLVPKLEEWGCDVCIHYKNFRPGKEITENIQSAVSTCRKTILVLSPAFMDSEWCYYEFLRAMDEMLRDQMDIIPLMYKDIQHLDLCDSMRHLLETVSYVPWMGGDGGEGQGQAERFWKPLKRAMETNLNINRARGAEDAGDVNEDEDDEDIGYNDDAVHLIPRDI